MTTPGTNRILITSAFPKLADEIVEVARGFHSRGWMLGTSGNLSAVVQRNPLRLAITASGMDKGRLTPSDILEIDADKHVLSGKLKPSNESALHLAIVRQSCAGAVFHTHSIWSTILSDTQARNGGLEITGYEMLKGLEGVRSHEHREWLPILENSQDMSALSAQIVELLDRQPAIHGFLLLRHGLYTWGGTLDEAKRHVEILEFLMEVLVRSSSAQNAV